MRASAAWLCRRDVAQARKTHDGPGGKFLRQFHAALISCVIRVVEVDIRQLLCALERSTPDRFDPGGHRVGATIFCDLGERILRQLRLEELRCYLGPDLDPTLCQP